MSNFAIRSKAEILEVHWKNISEQSVIDEKYRGFQTYDKGKLYESDAPFVHTFVKWENNDSFSFMINRKSEKVGEFRYDLAKRKLYRRVKKSDNPSPEEKQKNAALSALSGKNKKGVIRPASIKNESAAPK